MAWGQGKLQGGFRHRCVSCGLGLSQKPRPWKDQHLDLQGLLAAAASGRMVWAQAGIARATPFDGERAQLKKPESVTMACGAVPQ